MCLYVSVVDEGELSRLVAYAVDMQGTLHTPSVLPQTMANKTFFVDESHDFVAALFY